MNKRFGSVFRDGLFNGRVVMVTGAVPEALRGRQAGPSRRTPRTLLTATKK